MADLTIEEVKRGRINGVRATFRVDFDYEHVANTMWDLERFARIFPDILELRVLSEAEDEQEVLYRIDAVYKELSYVLRRVEDAPILPLRSAGKCSRATCVTSSAAGRCTRMEMGDVGWCMSRLWMPVCWCLPAYSKSSQGQAS